MSLDSKPVDIVLHVLEYVYPMDFYGNKFNTELFKITYNRNNRKYENTTLKSQLLDVINISSTCKYFNRILINYGLKYINFKP